MRWVLFAVVAAVVTSEPAYAWVVPQGASTSGEQVMTSTPLQRAMDICNAHQSLTLSRVYATNPPIHEAEFMPDWQADCDAVRAKWDRTETARAQRLQADQDQRDRDLVHGIATQKDGSK